MSQIQETVSAITGLSQKMEDEGKVDLAIMPHLDALKKHITDLKARLESKKDPSVFLFYFALKTAGLYVDKMIHRFKNAQERHDNPAIAAATLQIAPNLAKVIGMADTDDFNEGARDLILEEAIKLRNIATDADLLELDSGITSEPTEAYLVKIADRIARDCDIDDDIMEEE